MENVILESENIYYVNMNKEFIKDYLKMYMDSDIQKKLFRKTFTEEQILNWLEKIITKKEMFTMISKETNEFIGNIELIRLNENTGEVVISITPTKQNKHYGTEAIKRIIEYGFNTLNSFVIDVYKTNVNAIKCYKNVGFIIDTNAQKEDNVYHMVYKDNK